MVFCGGLARDGMARRLEPAYDGGHENRDLQHQQRQQAAGQPARLAARGETRRCLPAGAESRRIANSPKPRSSRPATARSGAGKKSGTASPSWRAAASRWSRARDLPGDADDTQSRYIEAAVNGVLDRLALCAERQSAARAEIRLQACLDGSARGACRGADGRRRAGGAGRRLQCRADRSRYLSRPNPTTKDALLQPASRARVRGASRPGLARRHSHAASGRAGSTPIGAICASAGRATPGCASIICCSARRRRSGWSLAASTAAVRGKDNASDHAPAWIELRDVAARIVPAKVAATPSSRFPLARCMSGITSAATAG